MSTDTVELLNWAQQIAAQLDNGWTATTRGAGVELTRASDGVQLFARSEWNQPGRATISLCVDWNHVPYQERETARRSISVSLSKSIKLGARDIAQRLLPTAIRLNASVHAAQDRHAQHAAALARHVATYQRICGVATPREQGMRDDSTLSLPYTESISGSVHVHVDGGARLDLTLDAATAQAVLTFIRGRQDATRKSTATSDGVSVAVQGAA